jgi:hypothetical protein
LTDGSDYWCPELLSQSLLGIWFAASHQPWMNLHFIILEICARKEWQALLQQEIEKQLPLTYEKLEQLPLLDSFIKETVRLHPLDTRANFPSHFWSTHATTDEFQMRYGGRLWKLTPSLMVRCKCLLAPRSAYPLTTSCTTTRFILDQMSLVPIDSFLKDKAASNRSSQKYPRTSPCGDMARWHGKVGLSPPR